MSVNKVLKNAQLSESDRNMVQEAWDKQIAEARSSIGAELRREFAQKYEHDKSTIAEAAEKFVSDQLRESMTRIANYEKELSEAKAKLHKQNAKQLKAMQEFVLRKLKGEVGELHEDRKRMNESVKKANKFIKESIANELTEFAQDKKALNEQRVALINEGRAKLREAKAKFIARASSKTSELVESTLRSELTALRQDIAEARENKFGRKIFEAFASEFGGSLLVEGTELGTAKKANAKASQAIKKLSEAQSKLKAELEVTKDNLARTRKMNEMLSPLSGRQQSVMEGLLESVQTKDLDKAFKRYLPTVLGEQQQKPSEGRSKLSERRNRKSTLSARDGRRRGAESRRKQVNESNDDVELKEITRLAGISKV